MGNGIFPFNVAVQIKEKLGFVHEWFDKQNVKMCFKVSFDIYKSTLTLNITSDIPFLNIHNPFTNERIRYTWTNLVFRPKGFI